MGVIGRPRITLHDAIGTQVGKQLRRAGIEGIKEALNKAARDQVVITQISDNPDLAPTSDFNSGESEIGYDYYTDPPTPGIEYPTGSERFDNLDEFLLIFIPYVQGLETQLALVKPWYTVQYVPIGDITQINLPHPIDSAKVWKNGIRLMEGASYDFTISGSSVLVYGIANDRFIVEYTTSWVGS
ncbi:MAG: hypothetical protein WC479_06955 [Candidatus Izemoplasmatales bacterium]